MFAMFLLQMCLSETLKK